MATGESVSGPESADADRLRLALNTMLEPLLILGSVRDASGDISDFRILEANTAAALQLGLPAEALAGGSLCQVAPQHRSTGLMDQYVRVAETGEPFTAPEYGCDWGGESRVLSVRAQVVGDGCAASLKDVTAEARERRSAAEANRELATYRLMVDQAGQGIWVIDAEGRTTYANAAMTSMLGVGPEGMLGRSFYDFMDSEGKAIAESNLAKRARGEAESHPFRFIRPDGSDVWTQISTSPLTDGNGSHAGAIALVTNVSAALEAAERLTMYQQIVELAEYGVWVLDRFGRTAYVNEALGRMLGDTPADMIGKTSFDYLDDDEAPLAEEILADLAKGRPVISHTRFKHSSGRDVYTRFAATPIMKSGEFAGAFGLFTDVSGTHALQHALEESNRQLSQFTSIASHDLQAPLRSITGFAYALQSSLSATATPEQRRYLDFINTGAESMQRLVRDLLQFSKLGGSRNAEASNMITVRAITDAAVRSLHSDIAESGAELNVDVDDVTVRGNERELTQAVQNLLQNAIAYRSPDRQPRITLSARHGDPVEIRVADNGIGIAGQDQQRIFEMFQRGSSAQPGSGIGLAIVARIAASHGGSVSVYSEIGAGSTFVLTLPAGAAERDVP